LGDDQIQAVELEIVEETIRFESGIKAALTDEEVSLKKSAFQALAQQAAGDLIGFAAHWAAFLALFGTRTCLDITGGRAEVGQGGLDEKTRKQKNSEQKQLLHLRSINYQQKQQQQL